MTLTELRAEANAAEQAFEAALQANGWPDRWHWYRDEKASARNATSPVVEAHDHFTARLHDFYRARDGEQGFLGSRHA